MASKQDEIDEQEQKTKEDVHRLALKRFKLAQEAEQDNRVNGLDDLRFAYGEQWPDDVRGERENGATPRPCLTINKILPFIKKVTNEARMNKPGIKIRAMDDKSDPKTADIIEGLIRQIQKQSNADVVYNTAYEGAVTNGFGFYRIITKRVDVESKSFDQEIFIERITNPFSVYFDPHAQEIDYSDANWCFISEEMTKDDFEKEFPDAQAINIDIVSVGDTQKNWINEETVRIAEYFTVEIEKDKLIEGINRFGEEFTEFESDLETGVLVEKIREVDVERRKIVWRKINGFEILEEEKWAGKWIPVIPCLGRQVDFEGNKRLFSLTRFAKDPARMYNYWKSTETELIALAPKAPFIGAEGQFQGHEQKWSSANRIPHTYLEYKPVTLGGQLAPAPTREPFAGPPAGVVNAEMSASQDIKEVTGIEDPKLDRGSPISGVALNIQRSQGDQVNFDFLNNLSNSIKHCGRILVDLIPKIYDTERVIRILGEDEGEDIITINNQNADKDGNLYDMKVGLYDVKVDTGPSFATKRQEASQGMISFVSNVPEAAAVIPDLIAKAQDWPDSDKIAERLKKTIAPEILGDEISEEDASIMIAQKEQENASLQQQLDQALQIIQAQEITKQTTLQNTQMKEEGSMQREMLKSQTTLEKENINSEGDIKEEHIKAQSDVITALIGRQDELTSQVQGLIKIVTSGNSQPTNNTLGR